MLRPTVTLGRGQGNVCGAAGELINDRRLGAPGTRDESDRSDRFAALVASVA
jgi:hypothetical protein